MYFVLMIYKIMFGRFFNFYFAFVFLLYVVGFIFFLILYIICYHCVIVVYAPCTIFIMNKQIIGLYNANGESGVNIIWCNL